MEHVELPTGALRSESPHVDPATNACRIRTGGFAYRRGCQPGRGHSSPKARGAGPSDRRSVRWSTSPGTDHRGRGEIERSPPHGGEMLVDLRGIGYPAGDQP